MTKEECWVDKMIPAKLCSENEIIRISIHTFPFSGPSGLNFIMLNAAGGKFRTHAKKTLGKLKAIQVSRQFFFFQITFSRRTQASSFDISEQQKHGKGK